MGMLAFDLDEVVKGCGGVIADKTLDIRAFSSLVLKDMVMTQYKEHKEKMADELRAAYSGQDKLELLLARMPTDVYLAVVVNIHALEAVARSTETIDGSTTDLI